MGSSSDEQRRYNRRFVAIKTGVRFQDDVGPRWVTTLDVSPEGVHCASPDAVDDGAPVLVELLLEPPGSRIECKGRICWITESPDEGWRFGVRFLDLLDDERDLIEQCVGDVPGSQH